MSEWKLFLTLICMTLLRAAMQGKLYIRDSPRYAFNDLKSYNEKILKAI